MNENVKVNENGQNLLIFAVIMVILVALAGLVIDGGSRIVDMSFCEPRSW